MKKVLIVLNAYSQGISGADKICLETWKRINKVDITILTSKLGKNFCDRYGIKAHWVITTTEQTFQNPFVTYLKRIIIGIWRTLFLPKQDILYSSSDQLPDILPALIMKLRYRDAQLVVRSYHVIPNNRTFSHVAQKMSWLMLRSVSATVITASSTMKKEMIKHGFSKNNVHIIYPGIDQATISINKSKSKLYDAVFMSRLHASKGIFDLVDIWKTVTQSRPDLTLAIIGAGDDQTLQKLINKIHRHKLQKSIKLLGHLSDKNAQQTIANSGVFVFPSHEEGFSITIAEVLAIGTPVIAYDLPIYKEIFQKSIITSTCFDVDKFSRTIIKVLSHRKKYLQYSKNGSEIVKKYIWKNAVDQEKVLLTAMHP